MIRPGRGSMVPGMDEQWEYACVTSERQGGSTAPDLIVTHADVEMPTTNQNLTPRNLVSFLNQLGSERWQLVAVDTATSRAPIYWLRRPVARKGTGQGRVVGLE